MLRIGSAVARRLASALLVLPVALFLLFWLLRLTGNPIELAFGDRLSDAELARRIAISGLDKPLFTQFVDYVRAIATGDFGDTFKGEPVSELLASHFQASIEVGLLGLSMLFLFSVLFGGLAAWHYDNKFGQAISIWAVLSSAMPGFVGAALLRELYRVSSGGGNLNGRLSFEHYIQWESSPAKTGFVLLDALRMGNVGMFLDGCSHLILPAVSLALLAGLLIRIFRDSLISEFHSEPIQAAISRDVPKKRAFLIHSMVPALPPMLSAFGVTVGALITGVVFIERIFEIKGLGYLLIDAVLGRDFMLIQGIFIVTFLTVALINAIVDLLITSIDKRQSWSLV